MTPNRGSTKYPEQLRKFVDTIERNAQARGRSAKEARLFGAWSACYVRYCTMQNWDWRSSDNAFPFLKYLKESQGVTGTSLRRAAEGLLFVFEEMMGRDLGDVAWRPPSRTDRSSSDRSSSDRSASSRASSSRSAASTNGQASRPDRTSNRRSDRAGRPRESRDAPAESSSGDETAPEAESSNGAEPKQSSMLTRLLFHTSLPINEALDLRAGDVDFDAGMIYVSDAMGTPKRIVEIPDTLVDPLHEHVRDVRDDYPGQPLDAPLFQANALKGRTAEASDAGAPDADASDAGEASEAESTPSPDPVEADDDSRPSLWHYAGN